MKEVVDFAKWLLERNIRAKNATSVLVALLSVAVCYFTSKHCQWFRELHEYGAGGVPVALLVVFLTAFLGIWLIYSFIAARHQRVVSRHTAQREAEHQQRIIRDNLVSLTNWQRGFLLRFIVENRRQIPEFEVGTYKATWDFEVEVLIEKGIIKEHSSSGVDVHEIEPLYYAFLKERWNPQAGTLE